VGPAERVREPAVPHPALLRVMIRFAAASAVVLLLGVIWASRRDAVPDDDPGELVRVGVVPGQSVAGYLRSSRAELAALTDPSAPAAGDTWALVSLDRYVVPGRLPDLLAGTAVAQAYLRVPLLEAPTPVVRIPARHLPGDVVSGMLDAALQRDRERAEYLRLSRNAQGEDRNRERARQAYESAARTAAEEAAAYRSGCACVFAAVVHAAPAALRVVADRSGVRVVDPAAEVRRLDRTEFRPPLPEQQGTVPPEPSGSTVTVPTVRTDIVSATPAPIPSSVEVAVTSAAPDGFRVESNPSVAVTQERSAPPTATNANAAQD